MGTVKSPFRDPKNEFELMYKHLKKCKRVRCEACVLARALKAEMQVSASYRKGAEESGRRWNLLEAHEQLKAADHIKWEEECSKISAENDDLKRRLDGVRYWLDVKDTITGDR
jgi:hypothetical protein